MKYILIIGLLFLGCVLFFRCKSTAKKQSNVALDQNDSAFFSLSKSTCRGKCEVYDLSVDQKGNASYSGKRNVDNIGKYTAQLTKQQWTDLQALLKSVDASIYEGEYPTVIADMQKVTIQYEAFSVKFQKKGGAKELFSVVDAVDELIKEINWKLAAE